MKNKLLGFLVLAFLSTLNFQPSTFAQGTAFTYQGQLQNNGSPASGTYALTFALFNTNASGVAIAGPVTNNAVSVTNGLFTTLVDFGPNVFTGATNWLQIGVATNGVSSFNPLSPRQQLTPVPYAIFANTASNLSGTLPAAQISGAVPSANLSGSYGNAVTLNNAGDSFNGTYAGNGAGVTNVNAAALNGLNATNFWQLGGNNVSAGQFMGSTNNQAVALYVGNQRAFLITTNPADSANFIGGSPANLIDAGVEGAVIAGGGTTNFLGSASSNHISANFASIGGGSGNWIQSGADHAFIGAGWNNLIPASSYQSVITGGENNTNAAAWSVIGGGFGNTASYSYGFIGGGLGNTASGYYVTVVGGQNNNNTGAGAFIGGGSGNTVSGDYSFIGGGSGNNASESFYGYATVGGGESNNVNFDFDTISGGSGNNAGGSGDGYATVGGGLANQANNDFSTVGGGRNNYNAGYGGTIAGGEYNQLLPGLGATGSVIGGGYGNTNSGSYATIPGGSGNNASASYSFAAGANASATNSGAFVWSDKEGTTFGSTTTNQFNVRANGGVRFVTSGAGMTLDGQPVLANNAFNATLGSLTLNGGLTLPSAPVTIYSGIDPVFNIEGNSFFYGLNAGNDTGPDNTGVGLDVMAYLGGGGYNTAMGASALQQNTSGSGNTADGFGALQLNWTGNNNTAIGYQALNGLGGFPQMGGTNNIALGYNAGINYSQNESGNIVIGNAGNGGENNVIRIGTSQTQAYIAGVLNGNGGGLTSLNASQLTSIGGSFNFFVGSAGNATTSGQYNTGMGINALAGITLGGNNTAYGSGTLHANTNGNDNTAIGLNALHANTTGSQNTAIGSGALSAVTSGSNNIAMGFNAGINISTTSSNIDIGNAGVSSDNNLIRIGTSQTQTYLAGIINGNGGGLTNLNAAQLTGTIPQAQLPATIVTTNLVHTDINNNFFAGPNAGNFSMTGSQNTGSGSGALAANQNGSYNTASGWEALFSNIGGSENAAYGSSALQFNTGGSYNTAIGEGALYGNVNGANNTAIGYSALTSLGIVTSAGGSNNIALGYQAGGNFRTNESGNIDIGNEGVLGENNTIRIGTSQTQTYIAGVINGNGGGLTNLVLGTTGSYSPTIGDGVHNFTLSTQNGYYTEMGNLVYFEIWLVWTGKGSAVAGDSVQLSLPVAIASQRSAFTVGYASGVTFTNGTLAAGGNNGASVAGLYNNFYSGSGASGITVANCATSGELQISGFYRSK